MIRLIPLLTVVFLLFLAETSSAAPEPFALIKASYQQANSDDVRGGLVGTAFFISPRVAMTAYHVLNPRTFKPSGTHKFVQLWLADRSGHHLRIFPKLVKEYKELDLALIEFPHDVVTLEDTYPLAKTDDWDKTSIQSLGYPEGSVQPSLKWTDNQLEFVSLNTHGYHQESGSVVRAPMVTVKAKDVVLNNVQCLNLSHGTYVGMSGGPTLSHGKVIGVNSFGFPADAKRKTSAWSVYLKEEYREQIFQRL